ncbi:MAG: molybdopterin cofactor-binding domain-containing protein [Tunicatimonas sp.]|uniref:xanthine dehydrogenase family protein molybdopterin-binding subunit n=1 Tax=Tunicatimonas sp. TaxID=1940096 RepID=UPI003C78EB7F
MKSTYTRRKFLKDSGGLIVAFSLFSGCGLAAEQLDSPALKLPRSLARNPTVNAWLQVLADGQIRIFTGKIELGQGISTAVAQVAAEELNTDPSMIVVHIVETGVTPDEGYTAGSGSIINSAMSVRYAAAHARSLLLDRVAKKLNVDTSSLTMEAGAVITTDGQRLTFKDILSGEQLTEEVPASVKLKPKEDYQWVGKPISRPDISQMVRGESYFIQDLRFPGMLHARVVRPPAYQATLESYDEAALQAKVAGIVKVVRNGSFLGVIAEDEYQAEQAQRFLRGNAQWSAAEKLPINQPLVEYLKTLPASSQQVQEASFKTNDNTVKAQYFKPYIMHGSIGPSCAVAHYEGGQLQIWSHSQGVYPLREALPKVVGLPIDKIHIKGVPGSGCYGHNGADDAATDAALLAVAYPGVHIRMQWSREEEHAWEPLGSAMILEVQANLDESGKIAEWYTELWSDSHSTRPGGDPGNLMPAHYVKNPHPRTSYGYSGGGYRNADPYYTIPQLKIDAHFFEGPLRVSSLRSLGAYANIFAIESFMDELAERAGIQPLEFRLKQSDDPRAVAVMKKLDGMTRNISLAKQEGMGFGFSRYKNSAAYCAVAAQVKADVSSGEIELLHLWGVIDAGETINPDGLKNQTEGGMIQSASWTLKEEVLFDKQHIISLNWDSYPILRFQDAPKVNVVIIDRPNKPALGGGEAAQAPTSAAIANAVYRASGKRIRQLPITAEKLRG